MTFTKKFSVEIIEGKYHITAIIGNEVKTWSYASNQFHKVQSIVAILEDRGHVLEIEEEK